MEGTSGFDYNNTIVVKTEPFLPNEHHSDAGSESVDAEMSFNSQDDEAPMSKRSSQHARRRYIVVSDSEDDEEASAVTQTSSRAKRAPDDDSLLRSPSTFKRAKPSRSNDTTKATASTPSTLPLPSLRVTAAPSDGFSRARLAYSPGLAASRAARHPQPMPDPSTSGSESDSDEPLVRSCSRRLSSRSTQSADVIQRPDLVSSHSDADMSSAPPHSEPKDGKPKPRRVPSQLPQSALATPALPQLRLACSFTAPGSPSLSPPVPLGKRQTIEPTSEPDSAYISDDAYAGLYPINNATARNSSHPPSRLGSLRNPYSGESGVLALGYPNWIDRTPSRQLEEQLQEQKKINGELQGQVTSLEVVSAGRLDQIEELQAKIAKLGTDSLDTGHIAEKLPIRPHGISSQQSWMSPKEIENLNRELKSARDTIQLLGEENAKLLLDKECKRAAAYVAKLDMDSALKENQDQRVVQDSQAKKDRETIATLEKSLAKMEGELEDGQGYARAVDEMAAELKREKDARKSVVALHDAINTNLQKAKELLDQERQKADAELAIVRKSKQDLVLELSRTKAEFEAAQKAKELLGRERQKADAELATVRKSKKDLVLELTRTKAELEAIQKSIRELVLERKKSKSQAVIHDERVLRLGSELRAARELAQERENVQGETLAVRNAKFEVLRRKDSDVQQLKSQLSAAQKAKLDVELQLKTAEKAEKDLIDAEKTSTKRAETAENFAKECMEAQGQRDNMITSLESQLHAVKDAHEELTRAHEGTNAELQTAQEANRELAQAQEKSIAELQAARKANEESVKKQARREAELDAEVLRLETQFRAVAAARQDKALRSKSAMEAALSRETEHQAAVEKVVALEAEIQELKSKVVALESRITPEKSSEPAASKGQDKSQREIIAKLQSSLKTEQEAVAGLRAELDAEKKNSIWLEGCRDRQKEAASAFEDHIRAKQKTIDSLRSAPEAEKENASALSSDLQAAKKTVADLRDNSKVAQEMIDCLHSDLETKNKATSTLTNDLQAAQETAANLHSDRKAAQETIDSLRSALTTEKETTSALNSELHAEQENTATLRNHHKATDATLHSLRTALATEQNASASLRAALQERNGQLQSAEAARAAALQHSLESTRARLAEVANMHNALVDEMEARDAADQRRWAVAAGEAAGRLPSREEGQRSVEVLAEVGARYMGGREERG